MAVSWLTHTEQGFYCQPGDFYIDPNRAVPRAVISHAHADHYPRHLKEVYGTHATLDLGQLRYREDAGETFHRHTYLEPFYVGPVKVTFYPAGHILGSAQVLMEYEGQRVLYSGDFSMQPNATCAPIVLPEMPIDLLICESTFGEKEKHSQPREAMVACLAEARFKPLLISVYPLGKAQHVTRLLTELAPEMPVLLHYEIYRFHQIYENHGFKPGNYGIYRRLDKRAKLLPHAILVTPRVMDSYAKDYDYHKVMATGWAARAKSTFLNGNLDISDHVDATDIQAYIQEIKPKSVLFWHGYPKSLIEWCQSIGIHASAI